MEVRMPRKNYCSKLKKYLSPELVSIIILLPSGVKDEGEIGKTE